MNEKRICGKLGQREDSGSRLRLSLFQVAERIKRVPDVHKTLGKIDISPGEAAYLTAPQPERHGDQVGALTVGCDIELGDQLLSSSLV